MSAGRDERPAQGDAIVTGASSGIGRAFALQLAGQGYRPVLVARRAGLLAELAEEIRSLHSIQAEVVPADLTCSEGLDQVVEAARSRNLEVTLLVNNAGFGHLGPFVDASAGRMSEMIALNCQAVVRLTGAFLPAMLEAGGGGVINVASVGAFMPTPFFAVYGASKAFCLSFTEALWAELEGSGVGVLCLCPGHTETPFHVVSGAAAAGGGRSARTMEPGEVVAEALEALGRRMTLVPGKINRALAALPRLLPREMAARMAGQSGPAASSSPRRERRISGSGL